MFPPVIPLARINPPISSKAVRRINTGTIRGFGGFGREKGVGQDEYFMVVREKETKVRGGLTEGQDG